MIDINLLQHMRTPKPAPFSTGRIIAVAIAVALVVSALWFGIASWVKPTTPQVGSSEPRKATSPQVATRGAVEDIVSDEHELPTVQKKSGLLHVPFEQMSAQEQLNYKILFIKKAFELFSTHTSLELKILQCQDYRHLQAAGFIGDKSDVVRLRKSLQKTDRDVSVKAKADANGMLRVVVETTPQFGLNFYDPLVDDPQVFLPVRSRLDQLKRGFFRLAKNHNLSLEQSILQPVQTPEVKDGIYRYTFSISGKTSFENLVAFFLDAPTKDLYMGVESLRVVAKKDGMVSYSARITLFTL